MVRHIVGHGSGTVGLGMYGNGFSLGSVGLGRAWSGMVGHGWAWSGMVGNGRGSIGGISFSLTVSARRRAIVFMYEENFGKGFIRHTRALS